MKIFIRVEGGLVTDVFADKKDVEVEVIDLDSESDDYDQMADRADEILKKVNNNELYCVH